MSMQKPMIPATLDQVLLNHASTAHGITYVEGEQKERFISYGDLLERSMGVLHHFQAKGASANHEIILLTNENPMFIDAFWAGILGGIIPVPVAPGISDEHSMKVFRIFGQLDNPYLYTTRQNLARLDSFATKMNMQEQWTALIDRVIVADEIGDLSKPGQLMAARPDDTAFIQFSSGSTSFPKGVVVSHKSLISNTRAIANSMKLQGEDSFLSWMPLTHDMGLIGFHLTPLVSGVSQYILPTELFIRRPLLWMQLMSENGTTTTSSPNFGYNHFLNAYTPEKAQGWDLSPVRVIFNGAEPISVGLCQKFLTTMAVHGLNAQAMLPAYGLAEATLAVAVHPQHSNLRLYHLDRSKLALGVTVEIHETPSHQTVTFVSEGSPVSDCKIKIADESGDELAEGVLGRILISGINVTKGYYGNPEGINEQAIVDGWLDTGDLGIIYKGELIVTGRAKDIIFFNGQNFYPSDLEHLLEQIEEIEMGKVAICGVKRDNERMDEVIVFVLHKGNLEKLAPVVKEIKRLITSNTGLEVHQVVPVKKLPKTTSGKIQRYLLGNRYLEGEFDEEITVLNEASQNLKGSRNSGYTDIELKVKEICNLYIVERNLDVHDNLFEMGTSSLMLTQIHDQIEEHWPGVIELTDYFDYPTIAQLAAYLEKSIVKAE